MAAPFRAAPYIRVSTQMQADDGSSLVNQETWIKNYIEMKKWRALDPFRDEGFSGGTMDRPALQDLLEEIQAGNVDAIVVYKLDRLSRNLSDFLHFLREIEEHQVTLVSLSESIDTSTAAGRVVVNILMAFAQFERETISQRVRDSKRATRQRGEWAGGRPAYGLVYRKGQGLLAHPTKAEHIEELFRHYLVVQSTTSTAEHLRAKFPAGRKWTASNVSGALRNPYYVGKVKLPDGSVIAGKHEAIVDWDTFRLAQEILTKNRLGNRSKSKAYKHQIAIVDLLECGCGSPCTIHHAYNRRKSKGGKRYDYVRCKQYSKSGCRVEPILGKKLEAASVEVIAQASRKPEVIEQALRDLQSLRNAELEDAKRDHAQALKEKKRIDKQIARLIKALKETGSAAIQDELTAMEGVLGLVEERIRDLEATAPAPAPSAYHVTRIRKALEEFGLLYQEMAFVERKDLFEAYFTSIIWHGTHAELVFADGKATKIMPLIDGKFSTEDLLDHLPEDLRLKSRRINPAKECVVVNCSKPRYSRDGLCRQHHQRTKSTGKPRAKLTLEQVDEIRRLKKKNPKLSTRKLGEMFGVSHMAVAKILSGSTWK